MGKQKEYPLDGDAAIRREYKRMAPVYDAAMAWNKAFDSCDKYGFHDAVIALRNACRAAKEVERGQ